MFSAMATPVDGDMSRVDIAIVGSDQASTLLAGVLARCHHKKVLLVQDRAAPYRLPREHHLSFPIATRPETFDLVSGVESEANVLLTKIAGRQVLSNVSPLCRAGSIEGTEALTHMMHMAGYFGLEIDRIEGGSEQAQSAFRIRGVRWVRPRLLWPALIRWTVDAGVDIVDAGVAQITTHRGGSARVDMGPRQIEADSLALTDGSALLQHGHKADIRQNFVRQWGAALLTEPAKMRENIVLQPEHGFCAWRQANGTLGMVARASADQTSELARTNIDATAPLRRAGLAEFTQAVPTDGAPVIGKLTRSGVMAVAGFGQSTLHLIPAIARFLSGRASDAENSYFASRAPVTDRQNVADFELRPQSGAVMA